MSFDYCELPAFFSEQIGVRARKEHKCCECGEPITPGQLYDKFTGMWDGRIDTYRQHQKCHAACRFIRDELRDGECIPFGALFDWFAESWCEYSSREKRKWSPELRSTCAQYLIRRHK